jgi:hypothetical protein
MKPISSLVSSLNPSLLAKNSTNFLKYLSSSAKAPKNDSIHTAI